MEVVNIGLPVNAPVPPKGIGVAPINGYPGSPAASVPPSCVGANGSPGSICAYGGQWIVPLPVPPGAQILNASCDVITNSRTVATIELVGRFGNVVTSKVVGPANGVFATVWLLPADAVPPGYTVEDGGQPVVRLSFKDSVTGAWTSGAQQMPIVGCAVNASIQAQIVVSPIGFTSFAASAWQPFFSPHAMNTVFISGSDLIGSVPVHSGDVMQSLRLPIRGHGTVTVVARFLGQSMQTNNNVIGLGSFTSTDSVNWTSLTINLGGVPVPDGTGLDLTISGMPSDTTRGVDVGMIALNYLSAVN